MQGDGRVFIIPDSSARIEIAGHSVANSSSIDGRAVAVTVAESASRKAGATLYLFSGGKAQKVSEEVDNFIIASSGNGIVYNKGGGGRAADAELWHYSNGKNTRIATDNVRAFVISPDGRTVAYSINDSGDGEFTGFVWNGKSRSLGEGRSSRGITPIAVSNDARFVYFNRDGALFVQRGANENIRERLGENARLIYANNDLSQVIITYNNRSFIIRNGRARGESLTDTVNSFVIPAGTAQFRVSNYTILGVSDFADTFYLNSDARVAHINGRYEANTITPRDASSVFLARDGKTLTYLRNNRIFRVNGNSRDPQPEELVSDVRRFIPALNGKALFFVNSDRDILYQKGNGKPVLVANEYRETGFSLFKDSTLFYISDRELFSSSGKRGQKVSGISGDVTQISGGIIDVLVQTVDSKDKLFYRSTNGRRFEKIHQN